MKSQRKTMLEEFQEYILSKKKKSDIISFLSIKSAEMLSILDRNLLTNKRKDEIMEFYLYFMENFFPILQKEIYDNWGEGGPLVLRLGDEICKEKLGEERKKYIRNSNPKRLAEAKDLAEILFAIRKNRKFTCFNGVDDFIDYFLPRTVPKEELKEAKEELVCLCLALINSKGNMMILTEEAGVVQAIAVGVNPDYTWFPVSASDLKEESLRTKDGIMLEPEDGVIYTELPPREKNGPDLHIVPKQ